MSTKPRCPLDGAHLEAPGHQCHQCGAHITRNERGHAVKAYRHGKVVYMDKPNFRQAWEAGWTDAPRRANAHTARNIPDPSLRLPALGAWTRTRGAG